MDRYGQQSIFRLSMRDQPFKRFFPSEKKLPSNYKYPTYQHYYQPKVSELAAIATPKLEPQPAPPAADSAVSAGKKEGECTPKKEVTNLKTELQHLKNEVHKIMQKKQGILRSPVKRMAAERPRQQQACSVDDSDSQSVSSDKIFGEAKRKLQASRNTGSYDYSKYVQLQNGLLKTELRNLKNKYVGKKKELTEKCDGLEQKVAFLEKALYKSEQELASEVTALKQALRDAQKTEKDVPTSDKQHAQLNTGERQSGRPQLIAEKVKSLYEQLNMKNQTIAQKQDAIEKLEAQVRKHKRQSVQLQQKSSNLQKLLQASKSDLQHSNIKLESANIKIEELQKVNDQFTNIHHKAEQAVSKDAIRGLQQDCRQQLVILQGEKVSLSERLQSASQELAMRAEQLKFYKNQLQEKQLRIRSLNQKYQYELVKNEQMESNFSRTMEITQKKHQQLVKSLQSEIYQKISALTPKKSTKERAQTPKSNQNANDDVQALQTQIKRWKIQYKILKQRHESYMKLENESKSQGKEYYRIFRESRQKLQIFANKNKLLEQESQRNRKYLSEKDAEILRKEVELKNMGNELAALKANHSREVDALKEKCQSLEEKQNEQAQRFEKQVCYRKQIQEKVLCSGEQESKEVTERLKKRLKQQDEKISKNIKEAKNKENLIQKLKQQLRQYMQGSQVSTANKISQQMSKMAEQYLRQQQTALIGCKTRLQQQKAYMQELQKKYFDEIEQLKLANATLKRQMVDISNQLRLISHSYNSKTAELAGLLSQRSNHIQSLQEQLQEAEVIAMTVEGALREEVTAKSEEIELLRKEIFSKFIITGAPGLSGTFDEVLRTQIEGNNRLKQQASRRTEQIYKLRDSCMVLRSQYENVKSENDINKVRHLSQKKNLERAHQLEVHNYKHLLESCEKKVGTLEQKMRMMVEQNQKKDTFIKNFMMGKAASKHDKEIISSFMKEYETAMQSKTVVERLLSQSQAIQTLQKYNESLLKQIALMKEKLFLFESIDIDQISVYESRISRKSQHSMEKELQQASQPEVYSSRLKKTVSMQDMAPFEPSLDG